MAPSKTAYQIIKYPKGLMMGIQYEAVECSAARSLLKVSASLFSNRSWGQLDPTEAIMNLSYVIRGPLRKIPPGVFSNNFAQWGLRLETEAELSASDFQYLVWIE